MSKSFYGEIKTKYIVCIETLQTHNALIIFKLTKPTNEVIKHNN